MATPRYAHPDLLDNGPAYMKANANRIWLVAGYVKGDSYATVQSKRLAEAAISSSDFTITTSGDDRVCTFGGKAGATATGTTTAGTDLCFVFVTTANVVLYETDESSDMAVTSGNTINFPPLSYTSKFPT